MNSSSTARLGMPAAAILAALLAPYAASAQPDAAKKITPAHYANAFAELGQAIENQARLSSGDAFGAASRERDYLDHLSLMTMGDDTQLRFDVPKKSSGVGPPPGVFLNLRTDF